MSNKIRRSQSIHTRRCSWWQHSFYLNCICGQKLKLVNFEPHRCACPYCLTNWQITKTAQKTLLALEIPSIYT